MYCYTDGAHEIDLCYACGKFNGNAFGDSEFTYMVLKNPKILLGMIKEKFLIPRE
jgi:serine phosphatase RsbU (regulator of sigma subunit)